MAETFSSSKYFRFESAHSEGNTDVEIYRHTRVDNFTIIKLAYLDNQSLLYVNILHPDTPGNNLQQESEYFYRFDFDEIKSYGGVGLEFNDINTKGILSLLNNPFNGTETKYFRKGVLIKSVVKSSYHPDSPISSYTYRFRKESVSQRLRNSFSKKLEVFDHTIEIQLGTIFSGLNGG